MYACHIYKYIHKELRRKEGESLSQNFHGRTEIFEGKVVSLFKSASIGYTDPKCKPRTL